MSNEKNPLENRLEDLLINKVTEGWNDADQREFKRTDWSSVDADPEFMLEEFEQAAAALAIAFDHDENEGMPEGLHEKLLKNAKSTLAGTQKIQVGDQLAKQLAQPQPSKSPEPTSGFNWREGLAWLALAASLGFILLNWNSSNATNDPVISTAQRYTQFVDSKPADLVNVDWTQVANKNASGNVVWSDTKQEGYMVFENLIVNDPKKEQYQLWIFDTDANQKYPVDGGVFDVDSTGKVIIPIDAKIRVDKAVQFAVTVEDPGGVVVSKREKIPVLAIVAN